MDMQLAVVALPNCELDIDFHSGVNVFQADCDDCREWRYARRQAKISNTIMFYFQLMSARIDRYDNAASTHVLLLRRMDKRHRSDRVGYGSYRTWLRNGGIRHRKRYKDHRDSELHGTPTLFFFELCGFR